jgi:hypothetical protein
MDARVDLEKRMKLSGNDVGLLAAIAVSGAVGMALFGPWRFAERSVTIESSFESSIEPVWVERDARPAKSGTRSRVVRLEGVEAVKAIEAQPAGVTVVRVGEGADEPPIVYLDGVLLEEGFEDIPPESIDRVEVLKGSAAIEKYGPEASAGVIQIYTKKGGSGS